MPMSKRAKTSGRSYRSTTLSSSRKAGRVSTGSKLWPYATKRTYLPLFDPFPARLTVRLRYSTTVSLTSGGAGVPAVHLFRANGIFDPDFTGVGHQPYGHDQLQAIYNHYRVTNAACVVQGSHNINGIAGVSLKDDGVTELNYDTIREAKGTNIMVMNSGGTNHTVKQNYKESYIGNKDTISAAFGANSAEAMIFQLWYEMKDSGTAPATASFIVNIVYDVELWELKDLGQS